MQPHCQKFEPTSVCMNNEPRMECQTRFDVWRWDGFPHQKGIRKIMEWPPLYPFRRSDRRIWTGTGETYAAAFAVKHLMEQKRPEHHKRSIKKVLFVVHREQIAIQAKNSFARVIGSEHGQTYGLLSGNHKDKDCTFLFSILYHPNTFSGPHS